MSSAGDFPTAEALFGPRPADKPTASSATAPATPSPTAPTVIPDAQELLGEPGSQPNPPPSFLKGVADFGAAAYADFSRHGTPDGLSTPALDAYFDRTPAGQVLKSFGQDTAAPFHALSDLTNTDNGEGLSFLKKSGVYKDWEKNHAALASYFRNSALRPAAQAIENAGLTPLANIAGQDIAPIARGGADLLHVGAEAALGYGSGVGGVFDQLRRDIINEPEDLSGLKGRTWEAKIVPYVHKYLAQAGLEGKVATEVFDTGNLAFSLTGIPQIIGKTNEEVAKAVVHAMPGRTPQEDQQNIQDLTDKMGFYEMLVGPAKSGIADHMSGAANIDRRLQAAHNAGVIGKPTTFTDVALGFKNAAQRDEAQMRAANVPEPTEPPPGSPSPAIEPSETPAAAVAESTAEQPDIHATARELAPETFTQYDPLLARHRWYTGWINDLREARDNDPRLARAQDEIDGILAKVGGNEDRLTNRARDRIADIQGGMEDFKNTDTPDMTRVKQEMLKNYQQMAELTPAVRQAYAQAADQMARDAAERGVESPVSVAHPEPESAPAPTVEGAPPPTPVVPPELPPETAHIWTTADIATDVSRQLQAAGRPKDEADAHGALIASHYEARAARFAGARGTASELYREQGPIIQGVGRTTRGQRTFTQTANSLEDAVAGNFYSSLTRGVEGLRQEKAPASQWLGVIDNLPGVKKEEIEWSEIKNWLGEQTGSVTKADLLNHLRENEVQVQEVEKGDTAAHAFSMPEALHQERAAIMAVSPVERTPEQMNRLHAIEDEMAKRSQNSRTKFGQHTLPGGENYRELLLTLPTEDADVGKYADTLHKKYGTSKFVDLKAAWSPEEAAQYQRMADYTPYRTSHFDEPNILAHVRFDDRTGPNGEKILHMAEVQSDWHQAGRRKGYQGDNENARRLAEIDKRLDDIHAEMERKHPRLGQDGADAGDWETAWAAEPELKSQFDSTYVERNKIPHLSNAVPDAPFKTSWHELAMKRMLRYAAENGYDKLTWDTGETEAARYDLSKQVEAIRANKNPDGTYQIGVKPIGKNMQRHAESVPQDKLQDVVGKDLAKRIVDEVTEPGVEKGKIFSGLDLKVGGEGMKGFYDKILPDFMNKYAKKWGGKVKYDEIVTGNVEEQFKAAALPDGGFGVLNGQGEVEARYDNYRDALQVTNSWNEDNERQKNITADVHSIDITPAMRDSVMEGQPLFQPNRGAITFKPNTTPIIRLMQNADASTFLHESGHAWLEELMGDAKHEAAPDELKRDAVTVRQWLGAQGDEPPTRQQHEKWARGFERYLMEGIAPTQRLAGIFAKFKQWLTRLYQSVNKLRSPITDDIRDVMDRLVAAPEGPTIIASPRSTAHMMADVHEVEAATAQPQHAGIAADHIDREVANQLRRVAPEEHDALLRSEGKGGTVAGTRAPARGRPAKTQPLGGPEGGAETPRAFPAGGDQAAPAGADVRGTASEGGGAAAGEHGPGQPAGPEPADNGEPAGAGAGRAGGTGGGLEFIEGNGPHVASEFSRNMEARAIAAGMPEDFLGELPTHGVLSKADQALKAVDILHTDPQHAMDIAMVEANPPADVMREFVVKAVENKARAEGDWETIRKLATNQQLANERTTIGRRLAAMADTDPTDPMAAMRNLQKARAAKLPKKAMREMTTGMDKAIRASKSSKGAVAALIEQWTCK